MKQLYRTTRHYLDDFLISLSQNRKISLKYLLVVIPAAVYLGMISFVGKNSGADFFIKSLQVLAFMSAGVFHLYILNKKISSHRLRYFGEGITYTILTTVIICLTLLLFYLFTDNSMAEMALLSSLAFTFPHICFQAWAMFKNIPPKQYPVWTSPLNVKDENEILMPEMITCRFLMSPKEGDPKEKIYFKTVPEEWKLGKAFYAMLKEEERDSRTHIEYSDESGSVYAWEFHSFLLNGLIKKRLEPEDTVSDNMITKHSIVHVTRVNVKNEETPVIHKIQYKAISNSNKQAGSSDKQNHKTLRKPFLNSLE